jgi:hypothetical protein
MRFAFSIAFVLGLVVAVGCSTSLDTTDYDTTCTKSDDCITLPFGDMCDCSCDQGAINKSAVNQYNDDRVKIGGCNRLCGACPALKPAVCVAGRCAVSNGTPAVDAGAD